MSVESAGVERAKFLANKVIRDLNAADPADALAALQLVVASVLEHTGIDPAVFQHRVLVSLENIRRGTWPVKEEASRG